jgi:hypothetical protein
VADKKKEDNTKKKDIEDVKNKTRRFKDKGKKEKE